MNIIKDANNGDIIFKSKYYKEFDTVVKHQLYNKDNLFPIPTWYYSYHPQDNNSQTFPIDGFINSCFIDYILQHHLQDLLGEDVPYSPVWTTWIDSFSGNSRHDALVGLESGKKYMIELKMSYNNSNRLYPNTWRGEKVKYDYIKTYADDALASPIIIWLGNQGECSIFNLNNICEPDWVTGYTHGNISRLGNKDKVKYFGLFDKKDAVSNFIIKDYDAIIRFLRQFSIQGYFQSEIPILPILYNTTSKTFKNSNGR